MKPNQLTAIAFVLGCFILVAYDILALVFWGADSTISVVLNAWAFKAHPLMMFLAGCVAGGLVVHFLGWAPKMSRSRKFTPHILVANEKHGDRLFNATTPEAACRALIKLFKERDEEGWYRFDKPDDNVNQTDEEIASLPERFQAIAIRERSHYRAELLEYEDNLEAYNDLKKAIDEVIINQQWDKTYWILYSWFDTRSDYEYEGIDQRYFEKGWGE